MSKIEWHDAQVLKIVELTDNIRHITLRAHVSDFNFKPGQFVTFDLPVGEKPADRWRSYSIASAPDGQIFELVIMGLKGGRASEYFFYEVKENDSVKFRGPEGKFILPEKIEKELCFICTGTGIAPFRSMLNHLTEKNPQHKKISLFFGTRHLKDVLFREEFESLQKKFRQFNYHFVLSKEDSQEYSGTRGHVHQLYEKEFADGRPADFYLCGWRGMIKEAEHRIMKLGYSRKDIHHEIYD